MKTSFEESTKMRFDILIIKYMGAIARWPSIIHSAKLTVNSNDRKNIIQAQILTASVLVLLVTATYYY